MLTNINSINPLLLKTHGAPFPYFNNQDPIGVLISTILSQRNPNERTAKAFQKLQDTYSSWEDVRDADTEAFIQTIYNVSFPGQKARRIQKALKSITTINNGQLSLDFLKDVTSKTARTWLEKLPGVGPKTSAAILNFSTLNMPALVIDSHHRRVIERIGWLPLGLSDKKAVEWIESHLPEDWTARDYYDHHEALMYHGQRFCHIKIPDCSTCPIHHLCASKGLGV